MQERGLQPGDNSLTTDLHSVGMQLSWGDQIDSKCTVCGGNAVDWVQVQDGTRRYACEKCLAQLLRFSEADGLEQLPDTPNAVVCNDCGQLTLEAHAGPAARCIHCAPEGTDKLLEAAVDALIDAEQE